MIKINIIPNDKKWYKYIKNPEAYIRQQAHYLNKNFKLYKKKDIFCTILLSGDEEIRKLNNKFRKKNKSTDVLSFPFYRKIELKKMLKKEKQIYLGDIIVNFNKIRNKKKLANFKIEFNKLWVHGLTHLFGYDHKKDKDFYRMLKVEKKFLSFLK